MTMKIAEKVFDKYFSFDARLESFQKAQTVIKPRTSSHIRVPKTMKWPHQALEPSEVRIVSAVSLEKSMRADTSYFIILAARTRRVFLSPATRQSRQCRMLPLQESYPRMGSR